MAEHARLAPSAASIWFPCPGQPALAATVGDTDSPSAKRGTQAHAVLTSCLTEGRQAVEFIGRYSAVPYEEEDSDAVQLALDYLRTEFDEAEGDEWGVEQRLVYNDDIWGTADFVRYRPSTGELLVVDYKHGIVVVEALENKQGMIYAQMKSKSLGNRGITRVRFVIIQPRAYHDDGPIREWTVEAVDMLDLEDQLRVAVAATKDPAAPLVAGKHCRWCNALAICPAAKKVVDDALDSDFGTPPPAPGGYDLEKLAAHLKICAQVEQWAKGVREFAYAEAERGVTIPGYKLVKKKATRHWSDPAAVVAHVGVLLTDDDIYNPRKLKSPAQLEAALSETIGAKTKKARLEAAKKELAHLIVAESSGHNLVPESDERPALRSDVTEDFAPVE